MDEPSNSKKSDGDEENDPKLLAVAAPVQIPDPEPEFALTTAESIAKNDQDLVEPSLAKVKSSITHDHGQEEATTDQPQPGPDLDTVSCTGSEESKSKLHEKSDEEPNNDKINESPIQDRTRAPFPKVVPSEIDMDLEYATALDLMPDQFDGDSDTQSQNLPFPMTMRNVPYVPEYEPIQIHQEPHYPDFKPGSRNKKRSPDPKALMEDFEIDADDDEDDTVVGFVEIDRDEELDAIDAKLVAKNKLDKEVAEERKRKRRARGKVPKFINTGLKVSFAYLPHTLKEQDFLDILGILPEYNYFYYDVFVPEKGISGTNSAFINFVNQEDAWNVIDQFQNYCLKDNRGRDYYMRVSVAMLQKIADPNPPESEPDPNPFPNDSIADKEYYQQFVKRYEELNGVIGIVHNEDNTITPELMLKEIEEIEEQRRLKAVIDTPLTEYIKDTHAEEKKRIQKAKEEAEARELERLRQIRKERKKRKERKERERRERKDRERRERREKEKALKSKERDKDKVKSVSKDKGKEKDKAKLTASTETIENKEKTGEPKVDAEKKESTSKSGDKKQEVPGSSKTLVFTNSKVKGTSKETWSKNSQRSPREWGGSKRYDDEYSSSRNKPRRDRDFERERDDGGSASTRYEGRVNRRSLFKPGSGSVGNDKGTKDKDVKDEKPSSSSTGSKNKDSEKTESKSVASSKPERDSSEKETQSSSVKNEKPSVPQPSDRESKKRIVKKIIKVNVKKGSIGDIETQAQAVALEGGKVTKISIPKSNKSKPENLNDQASSSSSKDKVDKDKEDADRRKRNRPDIQIYRPGRLRRTDNNTASSSTSGTGTNGAKGEDKNKESLSKGSD